MVFFNYATMQMAAKIVYYGPGLCGKTTNLHVIYSRTAPNSRGEMVSLETETDRTLFFDLLPLDVGVIGGFKTRLQLYTVPGQVFYNTTRKLVLKGVDGIVFVADSQRPMLDPNKESFKNLQDNLSEAGQNWRDIPLVLQYNKRDLSNILTVDELNAALNPDQSIEWYEASAPNGIGVFETLKGISKQTLKILRSKMSGELKRPAVFASPGMPGPQGPPSSSFPLVRGTRGAGEDSRSNLPAAGAPPPQKAEGSTLAKLARFAEIAGSATPEPSSGAVPAVAATPEPPQPTPGKPFSPVAAPAEHPVAEPTPAPETEPTTKAPATPAEAPVKHVRVRSNVDILSELDKLRKISTQKQPGLAVPLPGTPAAPAADSASKAKPGPSSLSLDDILTNAQNHRKEVAKNFDLSIPKDALQQSRQVVVALRFSDQHGGPLILEKTFTVDLSNLKDVHKLLISLKFNVQGE